MSACRQILPWANLCSVHPEAISQHENQANQTESEERPVSWNGIENDSAGMKRSQEMEHVGKEEQEVPLAEQRSLRVAIIGAPNAGKSTLVNQLLQQKVWPWLI